MALDSGDLRYLDGKFEGVHKRIDDLVSKQDEAARMFASHVSGPVPGAHPVGACMGVKEHEEKHHDSAKHWAAIAGVVAILTILWDMLKSVFRGGGHLIIVASLPLLFGCSVAFPKSGDRELNYQNQKAGEFVEQRSPDPTIRQAGRDISDNSKALERSLDLQPDPEERKDYSPKASADARQKSEEQHSGGTFGGFSGILQIILGALAGGGVVKLLVNFLPTVFGGPAGSAFSAMVDAVTQAREKAKKSKDGKIQMDDLLVLLEQEQSRRGPAIRALAAREAKASERKRTNRVL